MRVLTLRAESARDAWREAVDERDRYAAASGEDAPSVVAELAEAVVRTSAQRVPAEALA